MSRSAALASMAAAFVLASGAGAEPPPAEPLWTISSDECASVNTDGEPWDICGFQAFAMNSDGSRVLTVSVQGLAQLWDGDGRELSRVEWPNEHKGASGFPNGEALIAGNLGVAVVHSNQIIVLDLADGRILSKTIADAMSFDEFSLVAPDRLLAAIKTRDWSRAVREIVLPTGELREVPGADGWSPLAGFGPQHWVVGARAPFRVSVTRPDTAERDPVHPCAPIDGRYCLWRDSPGRYAHFLDLQTGSSRSMGVGREDSVYFAVPEGRPFAAVCRKREGYPPRRDCSLRDMLSGRTVYRFEGGHNLRLDPGIDEQGRPEIRLTLHREGGAGQQRVSLDGAMRVIDANGRANLAPPNGGLILPGTTEDTSVLVDRTGREVALLPFAAQRCGNGWPSWMGYCRVTADGEKWLLATDLRQEGDDPEDRRSGLTLYRILAGDRP